MAFTSAAAGLLAVAVIAAGTALASAGDHHPARHAGNRRPATITAPAAGAIAAHKQKLLRLRKAMRQHGTPPASPALPKPYGAVIDTGIKATAGHLVFFAVHLRLEQLPGDTFGLMGAFRNPAGHLSGAVATNETTGSDVAAGFHAVEGPLNGLPEFGYYAGPAAKITGSAGGRTIQASLARWSVNPKVVVFWFSPTDDPKGLDVTSLAAFDAHGKPLPPGNSGVGHG